MSLGQLKLYVVASYVVSMYFDAFIIFITISANSVLQSALLKLKFIHHLHKYCNVVLIIGSEKDVPKVVKNRYNTRFSHNYS